MRASLLFLAAGLVACAHLFSAVGCSSDDGGSTTGSSQSTSSSSGSSGASSGASSGGTTASTSGGSSSSGGMEGYQSCGQCTDPTTGAPANECASQNDACTKDSGCVDIYNCAYGLAGGPGCSTDKDGGCCTIKCYSDTGASQASINLYKAYDACVYCTTCKQLCNEPPYDTTGYCSVVQAANPMCP